MSGAEHDNFLQKVYFLTVFACCRENYDSGKKGVKNDFVQKDPSDNRGFKVESHNNIANFTFLFGCKPLAGVIAET